MHTLNIAKDVEYGQSLPPPFNIRPQLPCHSLDESLKPSPEISFMFLARRRIIYMEIARNMEKLAPSVDDLGMVCNKDQARAAMLALDSWQPFEGEVVYEHVHQMDGAVRFAGLLYYRLVYEGGKRDDKTESMALRLQDELVNLKNEHHIFGLLYHGCSNRLCLTLWLMFCGGAFAAGEVRAWYTKHIRLVAGGTGKAWNRIRELLEKFLFHDEACEGPMKQLWMESLTLNEIDETVPLAPPFVGGGVWGG